jgi:O-antigen/teichoic acid export membrane protein
MIVSRIKNISKSNRFISNIISNPIYSNSIFLILNTVINSLVGFIFWIIVARICKVSDVGIGAAYINIMTFIGIFGEVGLGISVIRFAPTMKSEKLLAFLNSTLHIILGITIILAVIFIVIVPFISTELIELQTSVIYSIAFIFSTLFFCLSLQIDVFFVAFQKTQYLLYRNVSSAVIRLISILFLGRLFGSIGIVMSIGLGSMITYLISIINFIPRAIPGYKFKLKINFSLLRELAGYSVNNYVSNLFWSAPPILIPILVISILGPEANAHYYLNWMFANLIYIIPKSISMSSFAETSVRFSTVKKIWQAMLSTILILIPLIIIFIFTVPVLLLLFGKAYSQSDSRLLIIFGLASFPYSVNIFTSYVYRFRQNQKRNILLPVLIALLSLGTIFILAPKMLLVGVACSWLIGQLIGSFFVFGDIRSIRKESRQLISAFLADHIKNINQ